MLLLIQIEPITPPSVFPICMCFVAFVGFLDLKHVSRNVSAFSLVCPLSFGATVNKTSFIKVYELELMAVIMVNTLQRPGF